jgi:polysaccharide biosynthesis protein PslG
MVFKYKKGVFFFGYIVVVIIILLGITTLVVSIVRSFNPKPRVVYHGPNPGTILEVAASDQKLDQTPKPVATIIPVSQPKSQDRPTKKSSGYGIAAGGGLTSLGQKDLDKYFNNLQSLGVNWVRWDIDWGTVQPDNATDFHWEGTDRVASTAKRYGINSLGIITYTPKWAADESCSADFGCEPADPKAFGYFAGQVAQRYKDSVTHWEIWNEQNSPFFWGPRPDVNRYADVLKEAYTEIKAANQNAFVITGGLAASNDEEDGSLSPLTFVKSLYALNADGYFDAIALHPYSYPASPEYPASWNNWQRIIPIRQLMVTKGDSNKKIWVTEYGAATNGPGSSYAINQFSDFKFGSDFMTESAQSDMLGEAMDFYHQHSDWMGPLFWYSLQDYGTNKDTPENFFGILRYDGSKKPAYDVLQNTIAADTK